MTEIYLHIVARMADYMDTHPYLLPRHIPMYLCSPPRSNWVSIEGKSYADINRLVNESRPNASGYAGRALGLRRRVARGVDRDVARRAVARALGVRQPLDVAVAAPRARLAPPARTKVALLAYALLEFDLLVGVST